MIKKRILDMGAGGNPDIRATDALDAMSKTDTTKERNRFYNREYVYTAKREFKTPMPKPKTNNKIKFLYNIDYTKDKLPYDDNSIDIIISNHSMFGNHHTYKEIYRILKPGGHVDIGWLTPIANFDPKKHVKEMCNRIGKIRKVTPEDIRLLKIAANRIYKEWKQDRLLEKRKNLIARLSNVLLKHNFKNIKVIKGIKSYGLWRYQFKNEKMTYVRGYK